MMDIKILKKKRNTYWAALENSVREYHNFDGKDIQSRMARSIRNMQMYIFDQIRKIDVEIDLLNEKKKIL